MLTIINPKVDKNLGAEFGSRRGTTPYRPLVVDLPGHEDRSLAAETGAAGGI